MPYRTRINRILKSVVIPTLGQTLSTPTWHPNLGQIPPVWYPQSGTDTFPRWDKPSPRPTWRRWDMANLGYAQGQTLANPRDRHFLRPFCDSPTLGQTLSAPPTWRPLVSSPTWDRHFLNPVRRWRRWDRHFFTRALSARDRHFPPCSKPRPSLGQTLSALSPGQTLFHAGTDTR